MQKSLIQVLSTVTALTITLAATAQGKVGINTTAPAAMLHVQDSSVVFTGLASLPATPGAPPVSGPGIRMMWYPDKAAFRAGKTNAYQWDKNWIGALSVAMGLDVIAEGNHSICLGRYSYASGLDAVAIGNQSEASGIGSVAIGFQNEASGQSAVAIGRYNLSSGLYSTSFGNNCIAGGESSTAMGEQSNATGDRSTAMGSYTEASGWASTAIGATTKSLGEASFSIGCASKSTGHCSLAGGYYSNSLGYGSIAMGNYSKSVGVFSFAMGTNTMAKPYASLVIGSYNDTTSASSSSWISTDPVFVIGMGTAPNARANAMTVLKNGKTGINTAVPLAMLHVQDSSVLFTGINPPPGTGKPPVSGAGTRMMWYADKAAFRAGRVSGGGATFWDKDSIGLYSIAMGFNTKAKGSQTIAMGTGTTASGLNSIALGTGSLASGNYSTAMGAGSVASGSSSTAIGFETRANSTYSTAMGYQTTASGLYSTAMGSGTTASGVYSIAMGRNTIANDSASTAFGNETMATGSASTAYGKETTASGDRSTAMGESTLASGTASTAMGHLTYAGGSSSTSMGHATSASGNISTTMGDFTVASGTVSTAMGYYTKAKGTYSTSVGSETTAIGSSSFAAGIGTKAKSYASTALGQLNDTTAASSTLWVSSDPLFIIGNGLGETRSNAMTVLKNGNVGIGDDFSPNARLHISKGSGGGIYNSNSALIIEDNASSYIQFSNPNNTQCGILSGNDDDDIRSCILFFADSSITFRAGGDNTRMTIEKNGYVGIATVSPDYLLEVNGTAGKPGGGSWTNSSDIRLKQNIHPYTDGLESVLKINPVTYQYNELSGYDTDPEYVGVIAQELQQVAPYMVSVSNKKTDNSVKDCLSVDNSAMTYMLINAVKEQQVLIEALQSELDALKQQIRPKEERVRNEEAHLTINK